MISINKIRKNQSEIIRNNIIDCIHNEINHKKQLSEFD